MPCDHGRGAGETVIRSAGIINPGFFCMKQTAAEWPSDFEDTDGDSVNKRMVLY